MHSIKNHTLITRCPKYEYKYLKKQGIYLMFYQSSTQGFRFIAFLILTVLARVYCVRLISIFVSFSKFERISHIFVKKIYL